MATKIMIYPSTLNRMACRLQYAWSRNYRARHVSTALSFGIAVHFALEEYYRDGKDPAKAYDDYVAKNFMVGGRMPAEFAYGTRMLEDYVEFYKQKEKFKVLSTELEVARRIPIPEDDPNPPEIAKHFYVAARVDAIVLDRLINQTFVLEHKTFEKFYPIQLENDHQFLIEAYVAEGWLKKPIAGLIYNGLRKHPGASAAVRPFERHYLAINAAQTETALYRAYWTLRSIHSKAFKIYPEPTTLKCNMCEFRGPCIEYTRGGDYQFMLDNLYEKREDDQEDQWL